MREFLVLLTCLTCTAVSYAGTTNIISSTPGSGAIHGIAAFDSPGGETVDTIAVVGLFSGVTDLYGLDLSLGSTGTIPNPGGLNVQTGIAYNLSNGSLYWVDAIAGPIYQTDLAGNILNTYPIDNGLIFGFKDGLSYANGGFWIAAHDTGRYFRLDGTTLQATGLEVDHPLPLAMGAPFNFGSGIAAIDGSDSLLVPAGLFADGRPTEMFHLSALDGSVVDSFGDFTVDIAPNTYILGNEWVAAGSMGTNAHYVVDNGTNMIYEFESDLIPLGGNPTTPWLRGDANGDGSFNGLTDGLFVLNFQFIPGSPAPPCLAQADANGDGGFNGLTDGLYMLNFQFVPGSPPIGAPHPDCGGDVVTGSPLDCDTPTCP